MEIKLHSIKLYPIFSYVAPIFWGSVLVPCFVMQIVMLFLVLLEHIIFIGKKKLDDCNCLPDVLFLLLLCAAFSCCLGLVCIV